MQTTAQQMNAALGIDKLEESIRIALAHYRSICEKLSAPDEVAEESLVQAKIDEFKAAIPHLQFNGNQFKGPLTDGKWMTWFEWIAHTVH
jgi:hypothetical protein